jgi:hypothetical protein
MLDDEYRRTQIAGQRRHQPDQCAGTAVDTPISTSGGPARRNSRAGRWSAAAGDGSSGKTSTGAHPEPCPCRMARISRRRSKARIIGSRTVRRWPRFASALPLSGLVRKSKSPNSRARTVISPPRTVRELSMMTPAFMREAAIASSTSIPFISGISISSVTRSGCSAAILASASLPLEAVPTTSTPDTPAKASETMRRKTTVSSTTSTLCAHGLVHRFIDALSYCAKAAP